MLKPIFAGRESNISSCLYGINRSICGRCILLLVSVSHAQQILENRNIFRFNVVELQCNQVDDWLGALSCVKTVSLCFCTFDIDP